VTLSLRCVTTQESKNPIYTASEAWNREFSRYLTQNQAKDDKEFIYYASLMLQVIQTMTKEWIMVNNELYVIHV
jgi:hypothetical protein